MCPHVFQESGLVDERLRTASALEPVLATFVLRDNVIDEEVFIRRGVGATVATRAFVLTCPGRTLDAMVN